MENERITQEKIFLAFRSFLCLKSSFYDQSPYENQRYSVVKKNKTCIYRESENVTEKKKEKFKK